MTIQSPRMAHERPQARGVLCMDASFPNEMLIDCLTDDRRHDRQLHRPAAVFEDLLDGRDGGSAGDEAAPFVQGQAPFLRRVLGLVGLPAGGAFVRQSVPNAFVQQKFALNIPFHVSDFHLQNGQCC